MLRFARVDQMNNLLPEEHGREIGVMAKIAAVSVKPVLRTYY
jgi:hypothetical protein